MTIPHRLALALLVVLACKPDKPVSPDDKGGKGGTGTGATTDIAPITRVAEMLPASTVIVCFWVNSTSNHRLSGGIEASSPG